MTTNNPTQDRNYYRMLDDWDLVERVEEQSHPDELALVLAERLGAALCKLEEFGN